MANEAKRSRPEDGNPDAPGAAPPNDYVTRSDLDSILGELGSNVKGCFTSAIQKYDASAQARFSHIESDVVAAQKRLDATEADNKQLWAAVDTLQRALALAESAVPHKNDFSDDNFTRKVDATILRISSKAILAKAAVLSSVAPWLAEADLDAEHYELIGHDSSRKFVLQFKGNAGMAKNRASKAHQLLRGRDGTWRSFSAAKPSGGNETYYISRDKNSAQVKRELDTKRLAQACSKVCTAHPNFHANRTDGELSISWVPIVRVVPQPGDDPSTLEWNSKWIAENPINRDAITEEYKLLCRPKSEVSWCL